MFYSQLANLEQAASIIRQVAYALAVGECACNMEHRDLHWGNVLVKSCGQKTKIKGRLQGEPYALSSYGVKVAIIDFTLSRLSHTGTSNIFIILNLDTRLLSQNFNRKM